MSPDLAALVGWSHHRVAILALEGLRKQRHVRQRSVNTKTAERMRVGDYQLALHFRPHVLRPDLRVTEKEALFRREAVDVRRPRFSLHRFLKRRVSNRQPAQISNALSGHELAFLVQARLHY